MGLSTHVLDTMHGHPARHMTVSLYHRVNGQYTLVQTLTLNKDGRTDHPLYADGELKAGEYRLEFAVAAYFKAIGVNLPEPPFLNHVVIDFGVANPNEHYHVPLLVSPWTYSTYRGS